MKTLTLIIPVFNEAGRIEKTLNTLKKGVICRGLKLEKIIFVNDGSSDETVTLIKNANLEKYLHLPVKVLSYTPNRGRGYAVRLGAFHSESDYVMFTDADFSIPLSNLDRCLPYINKNYDLIFGSKKKPGAKETVSRGALRTIVGYGHSILVSILLGTFAWDFQGGFKIFSRKFVEEVFPVLSIDRWGFDIEVIYLAKKLNFKNIEIPVTWGHVENDSKVKLARDIIRALDEVWQIKKNWSQISLNPSYLTND